MIPKNRAQSLQQLPGDRSWRLWNLFYLAFLFTNWEQSSLAVWLPPTLLSLLLFLPIYLHARGRTGAALLAHSAALAALAFALTPINFGANTYLIYAGVLLPFSGIPLRSSIAIIIAAIALYAGELLLLQFPLRYLLLIVGITMIISIAVCAANHFQREKDLRQADLKLSHDEVRRLAALAERERIGRDLHDLLGHTLSLITLKSELAVRLFDRDPLAARREIADVERVARDALGQVRRAVSGIRTARLAAEFASARLLLESAGVTFTYTLGDIALPIETETVIALCVREAVTNIQRHAHAGDASATLSITDETLLLRVTDDGRGGAIVPGNGLAGMRERVEAVGGSMRIESSRGKGSQLEARLPLPPQVDSAMTLTPALHQLAH